MAHNQDDRHLKISPVFFAAMLFLSVCVGILGTICYQALYGVQPVEIEGLTLVPTSGPLTLEPAPPRIVLGPWFEEPLHEFYEPDGSLIYHMCPLEMQCPDLFEGIERLDDMPLPIAREFLACRSWAMFDGRRPGLATAPPPFESSENDWRVYCLELAFIYAPFSWI